MNNQKPPHEPANTTTHLCNVVVFGSKRTVLKIVLITKKRNEEFRTSQQKKIKENLTNYLLDDEVIKDFVQQLDGKKVRKEGDIPEPEITPDVPEPDVPDIDPSDPDPTDPDAPDMPEFDPSDYE